MRFGEENIGFGLKRANLSHFFRFCCFISSRLNTFEREFNREHFLTLYTHTLNMGFVIFKLYFTKEKAIPATNKG